MPEFISTIATSTPLSLLKVLVFLETFSSVSYYDDRQIDSTIFVCVAIYICFFYKEKSHQKLQFYL